MDTLEMQHLYLEFLQLRESAREAKEYGIYPHTHDPIIAKYSFCNINREHDRVTQWIKANVRDNPRIQNVTAMAVNVSIARIFNDPSTFEAVGWPDHNMTIDDLAAKIAKMQAVGKRVFRGAYMMPSHGTPNQLKMPPAVYYLNAAKQLIGKHFHKGQSLEEACNLVLQVHGFGPFLANQITTDLRYTKWYKNAPDWNTFVLGGPGTSRGLCRYFGEPMRIDKPQSWIHPRLMQVREHVAMQLGSPFSDYFLDPNNISNSFCEFDKYARVFLGEGRVNRMYKTKP
jgi:hypothetical protein